MIPATPISCLRVRCSLNSTNPAHQRDHWVDARHGRGHGYLARAAALGERQETHCIGEASSTRPEHAGRAAPPRRAAPQQRKRHQHHGDRGAVRDQGSHQPSCARGVLAEQEAADSVRQRADDGQRHTSPGQAADARGSGRDDRRSARRSRQKPRGPAIRRPIRRRLPPDALPRGRCRRPQALRRLRRSHPGARPARRRREWSSLRHMSR